MSIAIALTACTLTIASASAQILQGAWVEASEAAIDQHRKTEVTVIVLDREDHAVMGASVRLTQQRHDFIIGLTLPADRMPPQGLDKLAVYRCLNAIALDRLTDWSFPLKQSQTTPQELAKAWHDAIDPLQVSFGRVISADTARNKDKLSLLKPTDLRDAVMQRVDDAMSFEPNADYYDLYADLLYQDMIERKLGKGMLHRMFDRARAADPDAKFSLRVRNAISLQRGRELALAIQRLEVRQVPFDRVTIQQRFKGQVQPRPLARMLDEQVATLPVPVTLAGLEVGGPSEVAAGLNMETLLRLVFAQPAIEGIYFSGVLPNEVLEKHAALLDAAGQPTPSGNVLDQLFNKHWRSEVNAKTDERGNINTRVFTGWYRVSATLPTGEVIKGQAYLPKSDRAKIIVLQQTAAEDQSQQ